jgi:metallo-beta-lactamase class B
MPAMSMSTTTLVALLLAAPVSPALSQEPFPPHRVADNVYYVGSKGLATFLITTSKGHILINPSFESTVPLIRKNVEKLGFKFQDVKVLLNSHAHDDHVGGMALARSLTGAAVYVMRGDDEAITTGGAALPKHGWKACPVDRVLEDGDHVTLGEATLTARRTPGHTRGCTTWTMKVKDRGEARDLVVVCSPNVNPNYRLVEPASKDPGGEDVFFYPGIASDYDKSFQIWKALPCDIFLGAHGNYYDMEAKYERLGKGKANPFVDPTGYKAYIDERQQAFRKRLAEQAPAGAGSTGKR